MRKATKELTLVAIILWINKLPEYLYQQAGKKLFFFSEVVTFKNVTFTLTIASQFIW